MAQALLYMLVFPDYDVKNGVPLEFEFDEATTSLIDEYIHQHRPQLMRGFNHDWLFPGEAQGPKVAKTLSEQISERLWKELGLEITPHQFRHAAAYIMLKADPGNYELVRRVLGHRSSATTRNFYIGLGVAPRHSPVRRDGHRDGARRAANQAASQEKDPCLRK